jgi:2-oxoacid:acceptor oxidoreductase delta subunit (pyruvate/2-ketoisovalerate family)
VRGLKPWQELPAGGAVLRDEAVRPRTGGWRTGLRPEVDLTLCVNCLLCWLYCPDSAIVLDGTAFTGFDYDVCKGCEICAGVCPTHAIEMEEERDAG